MTALRSGSCQAAELIVVDDGSTDNTAEVAISFGATLLRAAERRGPAHARNLGAGVATGDVLLFLDSDVCVHHTTVEMMSRSFAADPTLDAVIGSYDKLPPSLNFLSQYRNLMHTFVHQTGSRHASTFWSGCGAIRRTLFLQHKGFDAAFGRPAIEDIELGYRLVRSGSKIILDRDVFVTHLKRWTLRGVVRTDILDRGIPWTELILRDRFMPNDLNLKMSQRVSVVVMFLLTIAAAFAAITLRAAFIIPVLAMLFFAVSRWWNEYVPPERPRIYSFMLVCFVAALGFSAYENRMFLLLPCLALSPLMLWAKQLYPSGQYGRRVFKLVASAYITVSLVAAVSYLPQGPIVATCGAMVLLLLLLNSSLYLFFASARGIPFMLASIPFHMLYHFYSGLSFAIGLQRHLLRTEPERKQEPIEIPAPPASTNFKASA